MDTAQPTTKQMSSLNKVISFLTRPRGTVGKIQTMQQELEPRIKKLDDVIASLNGDAHWFRDNFCK